MKKIFFKILYNFLKRLVAERLFQQRCELDTWNFIKKRHQHTCFLVNFVKFLRASIFQITYEWQLLKKIKNFRKTNCLVF